jgi:hypothetical protein
MPYLLILVFILGILASKAQSPSEYTFNDGNGLKTWTVEDSILGYYFRAKDHEIVLHPKGELQPSKIAGSLLPASTLRSMARSHPKRLPKPLELPHLKSHPTQKKILS